VLDERLRALAHPVRRQLVAACRDAPQPAGALVALTGLPPASVSEHLKVLRKCGLLVLEVRGRSWIYTTDRDAVAEVLEGIRPLIEVSPARGASSSLAARVRRREA
jgi:DNA-binding transcriptional ArsR family regulator